MQKHLEGGKLTRRSIRVAGMTLSLLEREGDAAKPALVLLHGLIAEAAVFRKLIARVPSNRRIIALDLPGAGYSERPQQMDVSYQGMARVVHEAMAALDLQRPVLLGHSHGGAVALQLAAEHPEAVNALVLMCPAHPFCAQEEKLVRFWLSPVGRRLAPWLPKLPRWLHLFAFRRMPGSRGSLTAEDVDPYVHTLQTPGTVTHLLRVLESWMADKTALAEALRARRLTLPVLLLWGDRDVVIPIATAPQLTAHLQNWEMFTLPGVGHLPNEEAPEEVAGLIETWATRPQTLPRDAVASDEQT